MPNANSTLGKTKAFAQQVAISQLDMDIMSSDSGFSRRLIFVMSVSFVSQALQTLSTLVLRAGKAQDKYKNMNFTAKWRSLLCCQRQ